MAKTKAVATPQTDNLGNGKVDSVETTNTNTPAVDATKLLVAKMKGLGLDSKGLYTEWNNGAVDADGNNGAADMIDFMVSKKKLTTDDKTAILEMFAKMQLANTPKVKVIKEIPEDLAQAWKSAYDNRQQFYAEKNAAYAAFDKLWNDKQAESKAAINTARTFVESAGFYVKGDSVVATKSGSTTSTGEHGNAGTTKLSIGWIDIKINGVEYDSWKSAVQALEPSMISAASTNYLANTHFANKCAEKGLAIAVTVKLALKDHTAEDALNAWNALADDGKFASGAHRKLAEVGATITIA